MGPVPSSPYVPFVSYNVKIAAKDQATYSTQRGDVDIHSATLPECGSLETSETGGKGQKRDGTRRKMKGKADLVFALTFSHCNSIFRNN